MLRAHRYKVTILVASTGTLLVDTASTCLFEDRQRDKNLPLHTYEDKP